MSEHTPEDIQEAFEALDDRANAIIDDLEGLTPEQLIERGIIDIVEEPLVPCDVHIMSEANARHVMSQLQPLVDIAADGTSMRPKWAKCPHCSKMHCTIIVSRKHWPAPSAITSMLHAMTFAQDLLREHWHAKRMTDDEVRAFPPLTDMPEE